MTTFCRLAVWLAWATFCVLLIKALVSHFLEKEKRRYSAELEYLANYHKTKLTQLYADQARFIKELYSSISRTHRYLRLAGTGPEEERKKSNVIFTEHNNALRTLFDENRIYLSKTLADTIDNLLWMFDDLSVKYASATAMYAAAGQQAIDFHKETVKQNAETRKALEELEDAFRALLGSSIEMPDNTALLPPPAFYLRLFSFLKRSAGY